jgi:hypothetical protein
MRKLLTAVLSLALIVGTSSEVFGQKGSSGGGRSSSSVSSSGGRSYSSSSSSAGKSYSSSNSAVNSSGGKSYSSSSSKPSVSVAPTPSVSSSGGKSYSAGSSYNAGNKTYTAVNPSQSSKPKGGAFDGSAADAQKRVESKQNYIKGPEPKPTYTTPAGKEVKIDPNSKSVSSIRNMDSNVYITRETRIQTTYAPYYGRPVVVYNDPYNSFFWYWMLDRSLDERAMWAYHHRAEMDDARYREMLSKDARLEARIRELEVQNKGVRDTSYNPPGLDPDLQYTDDYVDSIVNPHEESSASTGVGKFFFWVFMLILFGLVTWFVVWLVFFKNW